jgi:hypothetical protein
MRRAAKVLAVFVALGLTANLASAQIAATVTLAAQVGPALVGHHGWGGYYYGYRPYGYYGRYPSVVISSVPAVVPYTYPAPPPVVAAPVVAPPVYPYPYYGGYYPAPYSSFYFRGPRVSFGIGF